MMDNISLPDEVPCVLRPSRVEEVDEAAYLAANPDAAKAGQTATEHFRAVGQREGRLQWANLDMVARLRAQKLARVQWRAQPPADLRGHEALNFLSPETKNAFGIPEDVPVSAHQYGTDIIELIQNNRDQLFLDLGAGLRYVYYGNVVNTDIYQSVCTDVICVGETLPFADEQFEAIFCFAVLEHTMRPWDVAREMCRVLKPGGKIFVDWPFLQPVHGYPHHYFNATPTGNRSLFEPYCDVTAVELQAHHHPVIAVQWILTAWRNGLPDDVARAFEATPIGTLINDRLEAQFQREYCLRLHPIMMNAIASGSLMTAVKRPATEQASEPAAGEAAQKPTQQASLLGEETVGLYDRVAGLHANNSTLRSKNDALRNEHGALQKEHNILQNDIAGLQDQIVSLQTSNGALRSSSVTLEAENAALKAEIEILRRSTSWRITEPLRTLGHKLRRTGG
jgi:SAM-dependent methyltransferase